MTRVREAGACLALLVAAVAAHAQATLGQPLAVAVDNPAPATPARPRAQAVLAAPVVFQSQPPPAPLKQPAPLPTAVCPAPVVCSDAPTPCPAPVCGPPGRMWVSAEYLLWWTRNGSTPALATGSPPGTLRGGAGVLPGAPVVLGGSNLDYGVRSGGRFTAGAWLDPAQKLGVEGGFFFLGQQSANLDAAASPGLPILARPVFNAATGREDAELVAFPGLVSGGVHVASSNRLLGAEGNALCNLCCGPCGRLDLLGGYRFLRFDENLDISEGLTLLSGPFAGSRFLVADQFATRNFFHGGQLGARATFWRGPWQFGATAKLALGVNIAEVGINGQTTFLTPGSVVTQPGGLLALPTNIGHYRADRFAAVPEAGLRVGYWFTNHVCAFVGYTFLYISDVARPGDQIDRVVNRSQLPAVTGPQALIGPARPAFLFRDTDFWAQGMSFGLEWRF